MVHNEYNQRVAFIGNYLPRQCGIATFTTDVCESFAEAHPNADVFAIPMNDVEEGTTIPRGSVLKCGTRNWPRTGARPNS